MRIDIRELAVDVGGAVHRVPFGSVSQVGPVEVHVEPGDDDCAHRWRVANRGDAPVRIRSVSLVFEVVDPRPPIRMFRNGYQSWSTAGVATFGLDVDPSTLADFPFVQATHHADQRRALDGELRSEWVTALTDAGGTPLIVGFEAGSAHDGTLRLRPGDGDRVELWAEAFLGDVELAPGAERALHGLHIGSAGDDVTRQLARWASLAGERSSARVRMPYQVGWCSWYHYFHDVSEEALRANLALAGDWPFDVFQLDDGYQAAIGDWLETNDKFPSSIDRVAADVAAAGRIPGIWIAPFLVAPDSAVARAHPDWVARRQDGRTLRAWWNPPWGGGEDGFMHALDTTQPEVLAHLESVGRDLVDAGYRYLKLDFTFAPSIDGVWADPSVTPAERVRAGYEAVRRGAGDDVFILGCGAPLSHVVGVVDGNRIGQDVAPLWKLSPSDEVIAGYLGTQPSTQNAYGNTLARSFMHRRLWLNDPDCIMLRADETDLSPTAARTWAHAVGVSGGMLLVSDDLALLGDRARSLLDETIAIGRESDEAARAGRVAVCHDLMEHTIPSRFAAGGYELVTDVDAGTSRLTRHPPPAG